MDPRVRKQIAQMKDHVPYFLYVVTIIHILMMVYALYVNNGFESFGSNPFLGPSSVTLIQLGVRIFYL